ncbi:flotillin family protein [Gloeothece verrucosa]|uniref:Band 7 protein n=1 Tax=Gloeothece verrucosa (strain PCC 7822) TaxID=497965 RepID=E0U8M6_GLOV7|nr:SPFH domain-containing protein [Gloeothece verrucosa]ADN13772.1 band 7 protein [Gloeothece verrucosa PCC 7822]
MNQQSLQTSQTIIAQSLPNDYSSPASQNNGQGSGAILTAFPIALLIFGGILSVWFMKSFLCICKPNEVVILCGRKRKTKDNQEVGYRVITGGRALRIPIVETVKRMDVTTTPIRVEVKNAYSKGGIPLNIHAIANVKISSNPDVVGNAIERFLDHDRSEIIRVAKETLEGNLRGVVATLTPEQVNEDRLRFAEKITSDVTRDLMKLGLEIDVLKIQNVADDVDYLNSLSRERIALIIRDAEIGESDALSEAEQIEAECEEQAEVAKTQDQIIILEKENELRKIKAKLEQQAKSEEEITIAAAKERRAKVEQKLQEVRAELERLRLQADEVLPAEAQREAKTLKARGKASILEENAKAAALVNEMLAEVWQQTGRDAGEIFLIQQLESVLEEAVKIPKRLKLKQVNVVDNGDGKSVSTLMKVYPEIVGQFLASVDQTLGIDVVGTLTQKSENEN